MSQPNLCPREVTSAGLIKALADGDDLALNRLIDLWQEPLITYLMRLNGNYATAIDLAQETFVRLHKHRFEFQPELKFSTWLFAIATNLARNHARWRSRHPECLLEPDEIREMQLPSPNASPDQQTMSRESLAAVEKAVANIPQEHREALILSTWHDLSHAEIAQIQKTTSKAVELRIYRARKLLSEMLADYLHSTV